jgi:protein-S-isoprenylcysteine O-methyltransferase Ste14
VDSTEAVLRGLVLGTAAVWLLLELHQSTKRRPEGQSADRGSRPILRLSAMAGAAAAIALDRAAPGAAIRPTVVAESIGLVILWCGIALRVWSFRTLGRYFTFTVQTSADQPVITAGPYRVIRHPSYAGMLLAVIGIGCFIANWWSLLALTAAVAVGIIVRIRVEERALFATLGDSYRAYAATHKRLVPFVW